MKTKFITLGYEVILATCLVKAGLEGDDEREMQPSESLRYITEVLQVQLLPNLPDATCPFYCYFHIVLLKRQFLTFKYLCILLGQEFGCDSILPQTPITEDIIAICNAYDPDSDYEFPSRPKTKEDIIYLTSEILQSQPALSSKASRYCLGIRLSESQLFSLKYLCIKLGQKWGCDIRQDTPIAEDIKAILDAPHAHSDAIRVHCSSLTKQVVIEGVRSFGRKKSKKPVSHSFDPKIRHNF